MVVESADAQGAAVRVTEREVILLLNALSALVQLDIDATVLTEVARLSDEFESLSDAILHTGE